VRASPYQGPLPSQQPVNGQVAQGGSAEAAGLPWGKPPVVEPPVRTGPVVSGVPALSPVGARPDRKSVV
jgi:hypothetical protein